MLGSLRDFLDIDEPSSSFHHHEEELQSISPKPMKRPIIEKKKKSHSISYGYNALDKTQMLSLFTKNYPQHDNLQLNKSDLEQEKNYLTGRKSFSQQQPSFFAISSKTGNDDVVKEQLKRQHNLLRAIVRTKQKQGEKITATDYEQSFQRMNNGLSKIKVKPIPDIRFLDKMQEKKTNRSLHLVKEKIKKSSLSHKKRLQFENCLSWSKKRNQNGSFYAEQLGKNKVIANKNQTLERRKEILKELYSKIEGDD